MGKQSRRIENQIKKSLGGVLDTLEERSQEEKWEEYYRTDARSLEVLNEMRKNICN